MKSAYEIAMARLEKEAGPTRKLSNEQKSLIAEIDKRYDAKAAASRLSSESRIASAKTPEEAETMRAELASEIRKLEESRDNEKEAIWNAK